MTTRFRNNTFFSIAITLFFMFAFSRVISFIPCRYSRSNNSYDIYPLVSKEFPPQFTAEMVYYPRVPVIHIAPGA
jgi:hypothetical protein